MAKGNLFQGMARGKVGDVVFSRLDGQQISRVRNRKPANPKTQGQLAQRAIMATVMAAYSAGKEIFDHSFEGEKVAIGNQRRFMSRNANALRSALIYDYEAKPTSHIDVMVVSPKSNYPVPNTYVISEGTLDQQLFNLIDPTAGGQNGIVTMNIAQEGETVAEWANRFNLKVGDIYTFVGFNINKQDTVFTTPNGVGAGAFQEKSQFFFFRLIATENIMSEALASDTKLQDIFEVESSGNVYNINYLGRSLTSAQSDMVDMVEFVDNNAVVAAIGCIRSAVDSPLRSTETLHWAVWNNVNGIDWRNLFAAWEGNKGAIGQSDLILEGGGENDFQTTGSPIRSLGAEGQYLVGLDAAGNKKVLTSGGEGIIVTGGKVSIQGPVNCTGKADFADQQPYAGALETIEVSLSYNSCTVGETGYVDTDILMKIENVTLKAEGLSLRTSGSGTGVELTKFVKA